MAINKRLIKSNDEGGGASFNTVTYPGTGAVQSITGVGFQPDLVWIKSISAATSNKLTDIVRGTTKALVSNTTAAETTDTNGLTAFGSDGFTLGTDSVYNNSDATYVAWCWKAGGAAVTNTDGDITSDVSANVDAGFSVVKWTTSSAAAWNVGHGLGVAPEMIISKSTTAAGSWWEVYHKDIGTGKYLALQTTGGTYTDSGAFSSVTSSSWTSYTTNTLGTYIAYCFAEKAGFSKIGSYSGNNSATGPTVTTDFEPAFVMIKRTDTTGNWVILDNKRDTSNPIDKTLNPNDWAAESTANDIDFNATTFQLKSTNADTNASGTDNYIYMAFANQF